MNKIHKPLARLAKIKRNKTQINKTSSKKRGHTDLMEIKTITRE